jgi:hypothetical protein
MATLTTPDTLEHAGEHPRFPHGPEHMGTSERNDSVRGLVEGFAIDNAGHALDIVTFMGGPGATWLHILTTASSKSRVSAPMVPSTV